MKQKNKISKTEALALMQNSKGRVFTATFTKKDGKVRILNGQYLKDQAESKLGYIKITEFGRKVKPEGRIKQVNLQTLTRLKINKRNLTVG